MVERRLLTPFDESLLEEFLVSRRDSSLYEALGFRRAGDYAWVLLR